MKLFKIYNFKIISKLFSRTPNRPSFDHKMAVEYQVLVSQRTWDDKIVPMANQLKSSELKPGGNYNKRLAKSGISPDQLTPEVHLRELMNTKRPQIFAESAVAGNGKDWTKEELSILGDVSIAMGVTIFDNGRHMMPKIHSPPMQGHLIFTPGALLNNAQGIKPCDAAEAQNGHSIDPEGYFSLYERRLMPGLIYANEVCKSEDKMGIVTIPGMGCGMFAGFLRGTLGEHLKSVLQRILEAHHKILPNIKAMYFDPYNEGQNERFEIGHISFLVRPLRLQAGHQPDRSQLSDPKQLGDEGDDFSQCKLFSIVAWDHVSWPGNDYYVGTRATDDGVKAAATDALRVMTQTEGTYSKKDKSYLPPAGFADWEHVVKNKWLEIVVNEENLKVIGF